MGLGFISVCTDFTGHHGTDSFLWIISLPLRWMRRLNNKRSTAFPRQSWWPCKCFLVESVNIGKPITALSSGSSVWDWKLKLWKILSPSACLHPLLTSHHSHHCVCKMGWLGLDCDTNTCKVALLQWAGREGERRRKVGPLEHKLGRAS